ncbi:hypothetical protein CCS79_13535 [Clostridium diolis]|uniref:helix-turn-helix transcriptional regulator n=1 Tax=Clostridium diolis TaxID=223919 RepID=UPI000B3FF41B|nr:helix-turn-helix transcriptional regulator [Clostridium diolis]OVE67972.1 hypothetical protein CCS79_13535 [Clostridium diolis]
MNNFIKQYREKAGLTQQDMANQLRMAVSTYNMIENGKRRTSLYNAKKISLLLKVSIDDLFFKSFVHI